MKIAHSMQGIYSPLPQSLSDSESEKEITMEPICTSYNSKNAINFEAGYRQNGTKIHLDDDIVKIKSSSKKMSTARKVAFVSSIIFCFLPFIFLWVLPCSDLHICPVKIGNWEYQQEDIELKGPINLVRGVYKTNYNLAMLYQGSFNSRKSLKNGLISFMGLTGIVAWDFQQEFEPYTMDCNIIDTNNDGTLDCLVIDQRGLKAIETISGQALWHAHSSEEKKLIGNLDLPIVIPDLNNDGVMELLAVFEKVSFLVISGKTGRALAKIQAPRCGRIEKLHAFDKSTELISYRCLNDNATRINYRVHISEIEKNFANTQYIMSVQDLKTVKQENVYSAGKRKLTVNNWSNGTICHGSMSLTDDKDRVLKTWTYNHAFIMNPKPFTFESSKMEKLRLRGHVNGFLVKIWQWSQRYIKIGPSQRINKRSINTNSNDTLFVTEVSERVVLITFNDTDVHVINASFTEINQICQKDETNCQPSAENHKDSLLVNDLNQDSSNDLVSFYSSYVRRDDDWHLISYVKVLRLEEDLPKLYGSK